ARSRGTSISVSSHWTWNFFVVMITPVLINRIGWKTFLVWMALAFSFVPIIHFYYVETSNISLEDIDKIFLKDGESYGSESSSTVGGEHSPERMAAEKGDGRHVEQV
ncbi:MAG: hypothetical protein M1823_007709, partial [Watsoniomyces obsoletus]